LWYKELEAQREPDSSDGESLQRADKEIASCKPSRHDRLGILRYALSPSRRSGVDWRLSIAKASLAQCPVSLAVDWFVLAGIATAAPKCAGSEDGSSLELLESEERSQSGAQRCHQIESLLERLAVVIQHFESQSGCFKAHTPGQVSTLCLPTHMQSDFYCLFACDSREMFDCWCYDAGSAHNLDPLFRSPRRIPLSKLHIHSPSTGNFGALIEVQPISTAQGVQLVGSLRADRPRWLAFGGFRHPPVYCLMMTRRSNDEIGRRNETSGLLDLS
jgi:hypothetical protein